MSNRTTARRQAKQEGIKLNMAPANVSKTRGKSAGCMTRSEYIERIKSKYSNKSS